MEITVGSLQYGILRRQLSASLYIAVYLVVETALQFGAHTGKFLRIQRDILVACCIGANADEVLHPGSAAEFSAARTRSTDAACFLSRTDLFHLNAHMEGIGKNLDELAEDAALQRRSKAEKNLRILAHDKMGEQADLLAHAVNGGSGHRIIGPGEAFGGGLRLERERHRHAGEAREQSAQQPAASPRKKMSILVSQYGAKT